MTIRFTALICPVFLLIFATAAVMDAEANEPVSLWMIRALSLFPIALYARIAAHVRDVAAAGGDPFDVAAIDRSPDQR